MKKLNKKTKKKIIDIADTIFNGFLFVGFVLAIIDKEYDIAKIMLLIAILQYLINLELKCNITLQIPNNDTIEVKKSVKKSS